MTKRLVLWTQRNWQLRSNDRILISCLEFSNAIFVAFFVHFYNSNSNVPCLPIYRLQACRLHLVYPIYLHRSLYKSEDYQTISQQAAQMQALIATWQHPVQRVSLPLTAAAVAVHS